MIGIHAPDSVLKERIAQAALTIFAEKGYAGTTIAEIAARAAVNPATVYRFFPGKRALFDSLQRPDLDFPDQQEQTARKNILQTALSLFSQKGYAATTMDEIAEAVGLSKAGIYFYFSSKESLFSGVLENPPGFAVIRSTLEQSLAGPHANLEEALVKLTRTYLSFFTNETFVAILRIILSEGVRDPAIARDFREKIVRHGSRLVAGHLQPFCDLEPEKLEMKVQMLFGMLFAWSITNLFLSEREPSTFDLEQVAQEHVQQFLYGMKPCLRDG